MHYLRFIHVKANLIQLPDRRPGISGARFLTRRTLPCPRDARPNHRVHQSDQKWSTDGLVGTDKTEYSYDAQRCLQISQHKFAKLRDKRGSSIDFHLRSHTRSSTCAKFYITACQGRLFTNFPSFSNHDSRKVVSLNLGPQWRSALMNHFSYFRYHRSCNSRSTPSIWRMLTSQ